MIQSVGTQIKIAFLSFVSFHLYLAVSWVDLYTVSLHPSWIITCAIKHVWGKQTLGVRLAPDISPLTSLKNIWLTKNYFTKFKLSSLILLLQIQKRKNYMALLSMIDWSFNIKEEGKLKIKHIVACCSSSWSITKVKFISCLFSGKVWLLPYGLNVPYNGTLNKKINRLNGRCLRLIYNDKHLTFQEQPAISCHENV